MTRLEIITCITCVLLLSVTVESRGSSSSSTSEEFNVKERCFQQGISLIDCGRQFAQRYCDHAWHSGAYSVRAVGLPFPIYRVNVSLKNVGDNPPKVEIHGGPLTKTFYKNVDGKWLLVEGDEDFSNIKLPVLVNYIVQQHQNRTQLSTAQ
uniref:Uncharacterized protein n=1 Tax=Plectus sambesii TaxID=2011161 RepID=A0A914XQ98_9BILA